MEFEDFNNDIFNLADFDLTSTDENSLSNSNTPSPLHDPHNPSQESSPPLFPLDAPPQLTSSTFFFQDPLKSSLLPLSNSDFFHDFVASDSSNNEDPEFLQRVDTTIELELAKKEETASPKPTDTPKKKRGRPKKLATPPENAQGSSKHAHKKRSRPKEPKESEASSESSESKKPKSEPGVFKFEGSATPEAKGGSAEKLAPVKIPPAGEAFVYKRDQLLTMTSADIEHCYASIRKVRELTEEEEKRYKKHIRLVRNRESAQKSRMKKRQHVEKLEHKISQLETQLHSLAEQNSVYLNEIHSLRERNSLLETALRERKSSATETTPPQFDVKKGVFLFVFIFSLGLFFRFNSFSAPSALTPNLPRYPYNAQPFSHSRSLLSTNSPPPLGLPSSAPAPSSKAPLGRRTKTSMIGPKSLPSSKHSERGATEELMISPSGALVKEARLQPHQVDDLSDDAQYIYCSEARRVTKGSGKSPVVGFLIPSDFLNGTNLIPEDAKQRPPLVEISCSVMDVHPIFPTIEKS